MFNLFFGNKRIAVFNSVTSFHMYLIERGIPHRIDSQGEIDVCEAGGYWYC